MSGRSAYVRKKITETKVGEKGAGRGRARSTTSSEDNVTINELVMPMRQDTGVGTTNARFLKFSETIRESEALNYNHMSYGNNSSGSQSGGSIDGRRESGAGAQHYGPLDDFAYARARRPNIRTEDVSGIEKSDLRSAMDKKSEGVRRGLAKAFTFGKKHKHSEETAAELRPQSSSTVRPPLSSMEEGGGGGTHSGEMDLTNDSLEAMAAQRKHLMMQHALRQDQRQSIYNSPDQRPWDISAGAMSPPPSAKLPPIPQPVTTPPIKRWIGAGRPVQRWNKLRKDPELWDPNGDVLVFFGYKGQQPRPNPSFRLSSHIIEATESRYLITVLREGSTEDDIQLPPSPVGAPPMLQRHLASGGGGGGGGGMTGSSSPHFLSPHSRGQGHGGYNGGQPTPPVSEDASLAETDGQISYEMHFPTPLNMSKVEQLRHHITTRNVFALLYHASLVGLSLYQALSDLLARLESYMPPESDNIGTIINYLAARGIDDVRNDPEGAVSILAWSENPDVWWEEGWRESFLHCSGLYAALETCADFKHVTPITRALLERASLETQLRVQAAEERLAEFQYADMWPPSVATMASTSGPVLPSPAKAAADRLQKFLIAHYTQAYGRWPPLPPPPLTTAPGMAIGGDPDDEIWLTRTVAQALQKDFAALYDYLVDRDIVWDESEARSGRKWMLISESGNHAFEADTDDLPVTDMFVEFDNKLRFPHIPHPYPLVPESIPPSTGSGKDKKAGGSRAGGMERRVQLAYTVATNMMILGSDFAQSDLIDAFSKFEKGDCVGQVDPSAARRGRWVLIYGILQTLASVSVDALNVRYRDGVSYHMSPRLKGAKMPPWRNASSRGIGSAGDEAAHEFSHCWLVPRTWHGASTSGNDSSAASSAGSENTSPVYRGSSVRRPPSEHDSYAFPRPPTMTDGATVRSSSTMSFRTPPGARSIRSSASVAAVGGGAVHHYPPAPFGSFGLYAPSAYGGSVVSSSSISETSSIHPGSSARRRISKTPRSHGGGAGANAISMGPVEEVEWPVRGGMGKVSPGLPILPGLQPANNFLMLDDQVDDASSYMENSGSDRGRRRERNDRPLLSRDADEPDSMTKVIRDFDDLDVSEPIA